MKRSTLLLCLASSFLLLSCGGKGSALESYEAKTDTATSNAILSKLAYSVEKGEYYDVSASALGGLDDSTWEFLGNPTSVVYRTVDGLTIFLNVEDGEVVYQTNLTCRIYNYSQYGFFFVAEDNGGTHFFTSEGKRIGSVLPSLKDVKEGVIHRGRASTSLHFTSSSSSVLITIATDSLPCHDVSKYQIELDAPSPYAEDSVTKKWLNNGGYYTIIDSDYYVYDQDDRYVGCIPFSSFHYKNLNGSSYYRGQGDIIFHYGVTTVTEGDKTLYNSWVYTVDIASATWSFEEYLPYRIASTRSYNGGFLAKIIPLSEDFTKEKPYEKLADITTSFKNPTIIDYDPLFEASIYKFSNQKVYANQNGYTYSLNGGTRRRIGDALSFEGERPDGTVIYSRDGSRGLCSLDDFERADFSFPVSKNTYYSLDCYLQRKDRVYRGFAMSLEGEDYIINCGNQRFAIKKNYSLLGAGLFVTEGSIKTPDEEFQIYSSSAIFGSPVAVVRSIDGGSYYKVSTASGYLYFRYTRTPRQ